MTGSSGRTLAAAAAGLLAFAALSSEPRAQPPSARGFSLEEVVPDLQARLLGLERAQGVLFAALIEQQGTVDESAVFERMTSRLTAPAMATVADAESDRGFAALGTRGAAVIRRALAFHREVLAIVATVRVNERRRALDAAVERYRSRPDLALGDLPKDMTILYDHPYTSFVAPAPGQTEPRRQLAYPRLTGWVWSAHWYQLAVEEPLERYEDPAERNRGLATVTARFTRKLAAGVPPDAFPTELPLAPSIAPGLVALHDRAASIIDNLNMMLDVIDEILVRPDVPDRRAAVNTVIGQFTDRKYRCVPADEWIVVALRHSIFEQGGPALGLMPGNERNAFYGGHGQHFAGRRTPPPCDGE
ncbi:MAG TPA: hypothetical protein VM032_09760 [Vicinamibacterales bacterium]|nr:hypothetical protein [Vicinamibacterales bacterium]